MARTDGPLGSRHVIGPEIGQRVNPARDLVEERALGAQTNPRGEQVAELGPHERRQIQGGGAARSADTDSECGVCAAPMAASGPLVSSRITARPKPRSA